MRHTEQVCRTRLLVPAHLRDRHTPAKLVRATARGAARAVIG
ncbi:MAG TPA: hypothetical protein PLL54_05955 [Dermatophilaceae bacterium]|nr:hypothetical protein [Dermatophilaceae bacterium]